MNYDNLVVHFLTLGFAAAVAWGVCFAVVYLSEVKDSILKEQTHKSTKHATLIGVLWAILLPITFVFISFIMPAIVIYHISKQVYAMDSVRWGYLIGFIISLIGCIYVDVRRGKIKIDGR
jgi:hypothetical protein